MLKPKYRILREDELKDLEDEFVHFLVVNGITVDDWEKMKKEDAQGANKFIILFSDVILEGSLRKIEYVELRTKDKVHIIQCANDKMVLVGISGDSDSVNFTDPEFMKVAMSSPPEGLSVYTSDKKYEKTREMEIFELTQCGFLISDGKLFKQLCLFL